MSPLTEPTKLVLAKGQPVAVDPYRSNVSLLLHCEGVNGSTTITDSSPSPKIATAFGDAKISTSVSKFGNSSLVFDGNGDYLAFSNSAEFSLPGDFTIEGWIYFNNLANAPAFCTLGNAFGTGLLTGLLMRAVSASSAFQLYSSGGNLITSPSNTISINIWQHIAAVRYGTGSNNLTLYINGINSGAASNNNAFTGFEANGFAVGATYANGFTPNLNGYIDDLRITKGVARYTANFTPPTAPFPDF